MRICTVHTHSTLCDGKNTLAEMARAAFAAGAVTFGASGHSHTDIPWDQGNVLPEDPSAYRAEVLRLREEYRGRMEVLPGIEQDSQSSQPVPDWAVLDRLRPQPVRSPDRAVPLRGLGRGPCCGLPAGDVRRGRPGHG